MPTARTKPGTTDRRIATRTEEEAALRRLARLYGVQTAYYDNDHRRRSAGVEGLLAVLRALGEDLRTPRDAIEALRRAEAERRDFNVEPVAVAWDGASFEVGLRVPAGASGRLEWRVEQEDGFVREGRAGLDELPRRAAGRDGVERVLALGPLPEGYHRLRIDGAGFDAEVTLLSARSRVYDAGGGRRWGGFLPLYALHTARSWGCGDFTDLGALARRLGERGGDLVATLPLLPLFLDEPYSPSPYSPVSRLFWNEAFIDVAKAGGSAALAELEALRTSPLVDLRGVMTLKRRELSRLAETPAGRALVDETVAASPEIVDYACFRAVYEAQRRPWQQWPQPARDGDLSDARYDESSFRYYVYAQAFAGQQLGEVAAAARRDGQSFYLDLPVGAHPDGYDAWRYRDLFAPAVSCGAPPDALFAGGQAWGFPPPLPAAWRRSGYDFFRRVLRHHLRFANLLRFDHVMGLHRLFWVPDGLPATEGVYVRYPADELYAVLSIESHRQQATIVGENLGTVPRAINAALSRHGVYRMYVLQYELPADGRPPRPAPRHSFASLNTHDMPPFASFLQGRDIEDRVSLGLLTAETAASEQGLRSRQREALVRRLRDEGLLSTATAPDDEVTRAAIAALRAGPARYVIVNLEDTWGETEPQNVPGLELEPNWRRRARYPLESMPLP